MPPNPRPGTRVDLCVSALGDVGTGDTTITVDVFRLGPTEGRSARLVGRWRGVPATAQRVPVAGPNRLLRCDWPIALTIDLADDQPTGVHLARLTDDQNGNDAYAVFTVCDDGPVDLLVMNSITTWQAYNRWPGRWSLYDDGGDAFWYAGPDVRVGFRRPYGKYCQILDAPLSNGSGEFLLWEWPTVHWLESTGHRIGYTTSLDLHAGTAPLDGAAALLSLGHDEFWSLEMFEHTVAARSAGLHLGFFSANTAAVRIDLGAHDEPSDFERIDVFGTPDAGTLDRFAEIQRFPLRSPSESELIGARSVAPTVGRGDWICTAPDHWVYADTGFGGGDRVAGLVGWEFHGAPRPDVTVVSEGPTSHPRGDGWYTSTVDEAGPGGIVVNMATCWWGDALSDPVGYVRPTDYTTLSGVDPRIQRLTANVVDRFVTDRRTVP